MKYTHCKINQRYTDSVDLVLIKGVGVAGFPKEKLLTIDQLMKELPYYQARSNDSKDTNSILDENKRNQHYTDDKSQTRIETLQTMKNTRRIAQNSFNLRKLASNNTPPSMVPPILKGSANKRFKLN